MDTIIFQSFFNGIVIGAIYAVTALGLNMIFGVMRVLNLSHGDFLMLGAYSSFWLFFLYGVDPYLSLLIVLPLFFVVGRFIMFSLIEPLMKTIKDIESLGLMTIIVTFGLGLTIQNIALLVWKADYRGITTSYSTTSINLGGIFISIGRSISFALACVMCVILYWFLTRTDIGRAIRATAQNRKAAMLMGVDVKKISGLTFSLGSAFAAGAGTLLSVIIVVYPTVGAEFLIKSFCIVILGGLGSITGTFLGGLILGIAESTSVLIFPSAYSAVVAYVILLFLLRFKPLGIFGGMR